MDLAKVLADLHRELEALDQAISCLERLEQNFPGREFTPELMAVPGKGGRRVRDGEAGIRKARSKGVKAKESS